jgi:hypothetical protein
VARPASIVATATLTTPCPCALALSAEKSVAIAASLCLLEVGGGELHVSPPPSHHRGVVVSTGTARIPRAKR